MSKVKRAYPTPAYNHHLPYLPSNKFWKPSTQIYTPLDPHNARNFCEYHEIARHETEDCHNLRELICQLIKNWYIKKYTAYHLRAMYKKALNLKHLVETVDLWKIVVIHVARPSSKWRQKEMKTEHLFHVYKLSQNASPCSIYSAIKWWGHLFRWGLKGVDAPQ